MKLIAGHAETLFVDPAQQKIPGVLRRFRMDLLPMDAVDICEKLKQQLTVAAARGDLRGQAFQLRNQDGRLQSGQAQVCREQEVMEEGIAGTTSLIGDVARSAASDSLLVSSIPPSPHVITLPF